jgi:FkbM family methyltransferase
MSNAPLASVTRALLRLVPDRVKGRLRRVPVVAQSRRRVYESIGVRPHKVPALGLDLRLDMRLSSHRDYLNPRQPESYVIDYLRRTFGSGGVAFDVGAHIGFYTVLLAHLAGTSGSVVAFEPLEELAGQIDANLRANGLPGTVERLAVSATSGTAELSVARDAETGEPATTSSLAAGGAEVQTVTTTSIDDYVRTRAMDRVDLIKVDVEGLERQVLDGAARTLRELSPAVVVEVNGAAEERAVRAFFADVAYDVERLGATTYGAHLAGTRRKGRGG